MFFVKPHLFSSPRSAVLLYVTAGIIASGSTKPAPYKELIEEIDDVNAKFDINMHMIPYIQGEVPTTTTTEKPIPDEWKLRADYRIQCVDEMAIAPKRVIKLMSAPVWTDTDTDLKYWILCVLNKMDLMSLEGVFRLDVAMSKFYKRDKDEVEALIDYCLPKKAMPAYEIAWKYVKCHKLAKGKFAAISIY